jgi:lysozyme
MYDELKNRIKKHEGFRDTIYLDSLGKKTIGYGHLVTEDGILPGVQYSKKELDELFEKDFLIALKDATKLVGDLNLPNEGFNVVIEMCFQLGLPRVSKFIKFLDALKNKDYERAADEMLDSAWHRQTPGRCQELSNIIRKCQE